MNEGRDTEEPKPLEDTTESTETQTPSEIDQTDLNDKNALKGFVSRLKGATKSFAAKLLAHEEFKPEDYTTEQIARDVLTFTKNPVLERSSEDPYSNPFGKRTIISAKGQTLNMGKPNSDAYRSTSQALESLVRAGALDAGNYEEEHHGETRWYKVADKELLQSISGPQN